MHSIKSFLVILWMFGWFHFGVFMAAYNINYRYRNMPYRFKRIQLHGISGFLVIPQKNPFLLTVEVQRWTQLLFVFNTTLFFICDHLLKVLTNISTNNRFLIIWGSLEGLFLLLSFVMHRASDTVIKLSEKTVVPDVDFEHHIKRRLRDTRKSFPSPQYSCAVMERTSRNFFWTREVWLIVVKDEISLEVVQEKTIGKRNWYRYYDGPVTQLIK